MASWIILYLHASLEWKSKVFAEIQTVIAQFAHTASQSPTSPPPTLSEQLGCIPPEAWDDRMPNLDFCLRETIRKKLSGVSLRHITADGTVVDGLHVEKGPFVEYSKSNTHLDPTMYDEPEKCVWLAIYSNYQLTAIHTNSY